MRSLERIAARSASLPLAADDVLEFHAARLLLLLHLCGTAGRIDSLTKMAKLDFFTRYPDFFEAARTATEPKADEVQVDRSEAVESTMVRHHYGPWDKRYYQVLGHLEARRLITVVKVKNSYHIGLSAAGLEKAKALAKLTSFAPVVARQKDIKKAFGGKSGTALKNLIYRLFEAEVGKRSLGQVIKK